jgi:hypothetical protein
MLLCFTELVIDEEVGYWLERKSDVTQCLFEVSLNLLFFSKQNLLLRAIFASKTRIVVEVSSMSNIL